MAGHDINPDIAVFADVGNASAIASAAASYAWGDFVGSGKIVEAANELMVSEFGTLNKTGNVYTFQASSMNAINFARGGSWDNFAMTIPDLRAVADGDGFTMEMAALITEVMNADTGTLIDIVILKTSNVLVRNSANNEVTLPDFTKATIDYVRGSIGSRTVTPVVTGGDGTDVATYAFEVTPATVNLGIVQS